MWTEKAIIVTSSRFLYECEQISGCNECTGYKSQVTCNVSCITTVNKVSWVVAGSTGFPPGTRQLRNDTMWVQTYSLICTATKHFTLVFKNNTAKCFVYTTAILRQTAGLSKGVCLYAGSDWLQLNCQRVVRGQVLCVALVWWKCWWNTILMGRLLFVQDCYFFSETSPCIVSWKTNHPQGPSLFYDHFLLDF